MELKKHILKHLFENRQLSDYQKKLATHGLDVFINDTRNYLIVLLLSLFLDNITNALYFIISFSILRIHCGGYHAPTKIKCSLIFICIYCLFLFYKHSTVKKIISFIISLLAFIYIVVNAPMEHIRNKLSESETKRNKRKSIIISAMLFVIGFLALLKGTHVYKMFYYSLISNTVLMIMLKHSKNWRYYNGNKMHDHR